MDREKEEERYYELYDKAIARMLDKTDTDVGEWMPDDEREEFYKLQEKLFGY